MVQIVYSMSKHTIAHRGTYAHNLQQSFNSNNNCRPTQLHPFSLFRWKPSDCLQQTHTRMHIKSFNDNWTLYYALNGTFQCCFVFIRWSSLFFRGVGCKVHSNSLCLSVKCINKIAQLPYMCNVCIALCIY